MMKKLPARILCLLLSFAMLFSLLPVSVFAADVQDGGGIATQAAGGPTIPGYTQVTLPRHLQEGREYLIVAQGINGLYALYPRGSCPYTAGNLASGAGNYGTRIAKLTISGDSITAAVTASNAAASSLDGTVTLDKLHLAIAPSGSGYTFNSVADSSLYLNVTGSNWVTTTSTSLTVTIDSSSGRAYISSSDRKLSFSESGTTYKWNDSYGTDFWGPGSTTGAPIYIYIKGDLPVEPGMNLANMLSGDAIGGGATADPNPSGQNSWVFTGGRAAQGSFADVAGARTYAGHFEEYVRYTHAKVLQPSGETTTPYFQRHVINAAYEGQTLAQIDSSFDTRIAPLKPRAVSYLVDEGGSSETDFASHLNSLITKALALQNNTGMIVIETLTQADKDAVDAVVSGLTAEKQANVLSVLFTLTADQKTGDYPNARGHFAMAQQLADAVAGTTVSTGANWPYSTSGSLGTMADGFPTKESLDHTHGYINPTTLSEGQQAVKTKVTASAPMTWLFMGDSITHGAAWTGGYDTLAQLFEKFVKDDLNRSQDIVINAGSSGATTQSTINDLNRRLVKYSPDVVVLMLGTNDASAGVSETAFKANLRTILNKIIEMGATAVLRTPPPTSRSGYDIATYAQYIREVSDEPAYDGKVILVDQYELWTENEWQGVFTRDTNQHLHPDEAGHLWFAHQLIKELALWNDSYDICRLEYVEMKEPEKIEIPGYTQITDASQIDENVGYLIVSQTTDGSELYALYPSKEGETLGAGALVSPGAANDGARAAKLTVNGETVTAAWLKDNSALEMETLLFTIKHDTGSKYVFTAFNGRHLNMEGYMFTEGTVALTITSRGAAAPGAFEIRNTNVSPNRYLDFTKTGDPNAFHLSNQTISTWGTDFWAPQSMSMNIYLFASEVTAPTAKESLQKLIDEIEAADLDEQTYTRGSWSSLQKALTAAKAIVENDSVDPDAQEVTEAWDALRQAYGNLNEKPTIPEVPAGATKIENWITMVPESGTTQNQPYIVRQTGGSGSTNFRIPAIITLQHQTGANASKNGRLVTAIDARWSHAGDACGLDTLVSYSDNDGANWNYNFANYFGDSVNAYAQYGTAFIDPVLVEGSDGTIYLMVDLWPGGVALNTAPNRPAAATGYVEINGKQRLVLYTDAPNASNTSYDYYVGDFAGGYAPVYAEMGEGEADIFVGYYIDEYYYLYYTSETSFASKDPGNDKIYCQRLGSNDWVQQNVFFYNATLHARDASYLWIVKSTDGGETWSAPIMVNDQVRTGADRFYGVGPGSGLCVETSSGAGEIPNGTIILPVYTWSTERAGFIYSIDNGATWKRGNNATSDHSSESCLVQLDNTTVRQFYRDTVTYKVRYTDHTWNGTDWDTSSPVTTNAAKDGSGTQLSAIKYSRQIDGKDVVILSTPGSSSRRQDGIIHVFLVNNDAGRTMELINTYKVTGTGAYYCYSSLSETDDGDIALLYESAAAAATFKIIPITDLIPDLDVTGWEGSYTGDARTVTVTTNPSNATLQYATSTDSGTTWSTWSETKPTFTDAGTYTVKVKATWTNDIWPDRYASSWTTKTFTEEAVATVKINKATPTISITSADGTALTTGQAITLVVHGVPDRATPDHITLACSNTAEGHDPNITLTKQADGTYTGTHQVMEGSHTFTATYSESANYVGTTAAYSVTVSDVAISVKPFTGVYDGDEHTITVTKGDGVEVVYRTAAAGEYDLTEPPAYTNAGTYTIYYKATHTQSGVETEGSANVTISKATPTITFQCNHEEEHGSDVEHTIETTDLPLVLTIKGVPAEDQGHFTLTTFNDAVRNLTHNNDGTWTASPNLPPITRTYHFIAVFDPTVDQEGNAIPNPNYERTTAEFTVTVSRPPDEVIDFKFDFASEVTIDPDLTTKGTLTIPYDGAPHGPLSALECDEERELVLTYHVSEENAEIGSDAWSSEEPTFRQPGTYTVSCMASPIDSSVARVLTVVLVIEERDIPTDLAITPSVEELEGGGTVTLTVTGAPAAGTLTVTCDKRGVQVTEIERGTYTATLPDSDAAYTFTASYSGAGSYQSADATCVVIVSSASQSGAAKLSSLTLSEGTLQPAFSADVTAYTVSVAADVESVTVTATGVAGAEAVVKKDGVVCANGVVSLAEGENVVTVTVSKDGVTSTDYTITITRGDETGGNLPTLPPIPSTTTTTTTTNPDGSTTTTVTDNVTGTVTETTEKNDGSVEVVETKKDGTVTTTVTAPDGGKVEKVTTPDEDVTITVTNADGEELAKVEIPAEIPALDADKTFTDVREGYFAEEAINNMAALGVVNGKGDRIFDPKSPMKRSELAKVLYELANGKEGYTTDFTDVPSTKWYADSVAWAVKAGVVKGVSDTEFEPERTITREELAAMLCRYARMLGMDTTAQTSELDVFSDGATTHAWAASDMAWCVQNGILQGKGNGVLDPRSEATRAEVAVMLQRFVNLIK